MTEFLIDIILSRISAGDMRYRKILLASLAEIDFLIPLVQKTEDSSKELLKPAYQEVDSKRTFYIYSSEEHYKKSEFADYEFTTVNSQEFCSDLKGKCFLRLNFNNELSTELTPMEIRTIASSSLKVNHYIQNLSREISKKERREVVIEELARISSNTNFIDETYFEELCEKEGLAICGIISKTTSAEARFKLTEQIAALSLLFYLEPGAIEVLSDLSGKDWQLFSSLTPIYERIQEAEEKAKESQTLSFTAQDNQATNTLLKRISNRFFPN